MENETVSLWNKQTTELTVGDSVKFAVGVTVLTTAATIAIFAGVAGITHLAAKLSERRAAKKDMKTEQE